MADISNGTVVPPSRRVIGQDAGRGSLPKPLTSLMALANAPEEAWRPGPRRSLTHREAEVAALAASGLTNREIAAQLFLSVRTVEVHVDHILTKLGFHTRSQLAAWAYEEGLLPGNT